MTRTRATGFIFLTSIFPIAILGCPKKDPPPPDAALPAPTPTPSETALAPLVEDSGPEDTGVDTGVKPTGTGLNANQYRVKQCCNAIRSQGKSLGTAPEAANFTNAAAMCDQLVGVVGPSSQGQVPELAPVKTMLQGKTLPPLCQGL